MITESSTEHRNFLRGIYVLLYLSIAMFYSVTLWKIRNPSPYADDFNLVVEFLSNWVSSPDLKYIIEIHNEHPQMLIKFASIIVYYFFHTISFSALTCISMVGPISFSILILGMTAQILEKKIVDAIIWALPVICLILQPGAWGCTLWISSGLNHGMLPSLMLASLIAVNSGRNHLALLIGLVSACVGGAGIFIVVIIFGILILRACSPKTIISLIGASLFLVLSYVVVENYRQGGFSNIVQLGLYVLAFIGNFGNWHSPLRSAVVGVVILIFNVLIFKSVKEFRLFGGVIVFVLMAGGASAILRYPGGGLPHALLSRYQFYGISIAAITFIGAMKYAPSFQKVIWVGGMCLFGTVAVRSFVSVPAVAFAHHLAQNRDIVFSRFDSTIPIGDYGPREAIDDILKRASNAGVFDSAPPAWVFQPLEEQNIKMPLSSAPVRYEVELQGEDSQYWAARGWAVIEAEKTIVPTRYCVVAEDTTHTDLNYRFCFPSKEREDIAARLKIDSNLLRNDSHLGFRFLIPKKLLARGEYRIGLMVHGSRNWHVAWFGQSLAVL